MIGLRHRAVLVLLKIYVAGALIAAAILSHPALSFIPILLLAAYFFLWRWPISPAIKLLADYFMFFTVAILLSPPIGPIFSLLISLPVLLLITGSLEEAAEELPYRDTTQIRIPTRVSVVLPLIAALALVASLLLGSLPLLLASTVIIAYFAILGAIVIRKLPIKPVEEIQIQQRMVAGTKADLNISLTTKTSLGGTLFVESPHEWLKMDSNVLSLKGTNLVLRVHLSPPLSGPSLIKLKAYATDRWGLIQTGFELAPIRLYVIPRARYADWLVRKYIAGTQPGVLPMISNVEKIRPIYGFRRGIEYYGSQLYQPGDSLKNIDWKHSLQHNELITKEFAESHGQPAVVMINLSAGNAEEADKLAYKILVTALSLAQENIPATLAAYDHDDVKITTTALQPQQLARHCLEIAREIVTIANPVRYLNPPDAARLKANIDRIRFAKSKAAKVLLRLLELEYRSLSNNARLNPASKALATVLGRGNRQANILIISQYNHDAEALAFNTVSLLAKGNTVIKV